MPIIITKTTARNIDYLITCRTKLGIPDDNKFLFARPGTQNLFSGSAILREFRDSLNLKRPEHMTATGLRHNLATNSRNAKHIPTDDMAEQMGHTLHIHKTKYRYPLQVVQKGQIGAHLFELGVSQ